MGMTNYRDMELKGGFTMFYCSTCECLSIGCPKCDNSSCNGGSCDYCTREIDSFSKDYNAWIRDNVISWGTIRFNHESFLMGHLFGDERMKAFDDMKDNPEEWV